MGALEFMQCLTQALTTSARKSLVQSTKAGPPDPASALASCFKRFTLPCCTSVDPALLKTWTVSECLVTLNNAVMRNLFLWRGCRMD